MPVYRYKLLGPEGGIEKDTVELPFEDPIPAIRYLERQGGVVVKIDRLARFLGTLALIERHGLTKITRQDLAEFFNNLSMMLSAGVPILSALKEIGQDLQNRRLKTLISFICTDIELGQTFSESFAKHRRIFPDLVINMIRIGEETGRLDQMSLKISEHYQHVDKIISDTKRAVRYPSAVLVLVCGAVAFWFLYVVPQIIGLFQELDLTLPFITKLLLYISNVVQATYMWIVLGLIILVVSVMLGRRHIGKFRYWSDAIFLRLPIVSRIIETSLIARITENLGILLGAGVTVTRTLNIIIDSLNNLVYKQRMEGVKNQVMLGNSISESMRETKALHVFAIRMIAVGEETGRLDEQTEYVARVYRDRLDKLVATLSQTIEPLLLTVMGLIFALVIAGLLFPVYDLITKIQM
ncbi:MAG: type II secretion system F family protein [Desulfohalobiaceae bacterium]|nr:type II secretion system F family protein [Desulfohalobiaceae bacterium]MCF8085648.1 type II secretion system F family protein [Desulfohalobiaceae bacterium]